MEEVEDNYEKIDVTKDCSLRNFIEDIKKFENPYERGCSYYELTDKEVDIDSGKEVMLMNKVSIIYIYYIVACSYNSQHLMHTQHSRQVNCLQAKQQERELEHLELI